MVRRASSENVERIEHLVDRNILIQGNILDQSSIVSTNAEAHLM